LTTGTAVAEAFGVIAAVPFLLLLLVAGISKLPMLLGSRFQPFWKKVSQWILYTVLFSLVPIVFDYMIEFAKGGGSWPDVAQVVRHGELCLVATAMSCVAIGEMSGYKSTGNTGRVWLFWFCLLSAAVSIGLYVIMKSIANAQTIGAQYDSQLNMSSQILGLPLPNIRHNVLFMSVGRADRR
jgi:hypothetical protein